MKKVDYFSGKLFRNRITRIIILGGLLSLVSHAVSAQLTADFIASPTSVCAGSSVTFTDNTFNITGSAEYSWNFGNGASPATATGAGPHSVTYSVEGSVTVTLSVTDASGTDEEIKTDYITVSGVAPSFTLCPGSTIMQDADPGFCTAIVDYASLVVASGSPEPVLSYTYSGATTGSGSGTGSGSALNIGTTLVEITATNSCSVTVTCSFSVFVNTSPVADAGGPYESCQGSGVTLSGSSSYDPDGECGDIISDYEWDINNDGTDDLSGAIQTLSHVQLVGYGLGVGGHTIKLSVQDNYGVSHSDYTTLTIHALPVVSITGSSSICVGSTTTLSPSADGDWVSNNETVATVTTDGVVTGVGEGTATFTFTSSLTGCSSTTSAVSVNSLPDAPTASLTQPTCSEPTGTITVTSPLGATIEYSLDGGAWVSTTTFSGLVADASYTLSSRDTGSDPTCVSSAVFVIDAVPSAPPTPTASLTQPTCSEPTGTITVTSPLGA
ncbi:MAG: PKD domain-containing protein, partial [Bacteroidales bacterium]|nr:PKD domain-containing protein [Bacteroidales bacterium]